MKILISNNYKIETDERQYILKEIKIGKSGEAKGAKREFVVGYFSTFVNAIKAWKNRDLRQSDCTTLEEVMQHMVEQDKIISNLLKKDETIMDNVPLKCLDLLNPFKKRETIMRLTILIVALGTFIIPTIANAHGGGCRKDSPTGQCCHAGSKPYHCH